MDRFIFMHRFRPMCGTVKDPLKGTVPDRQYGHVYGQCRNADTSRNGCGRPRAVLSFFRVDPTLIGTTRQLTSMVRLGRWIRQNNYFFDLTDGCTYYLGVDEPVLDPENGKME